MLVSDEQLRDACNRLDLNPVGRVEVRGYDTELELGDAEDWDGDDCWNLAYAVVSGADYPDPGRLGLAAGHLSPGWEFLRRLVDTIAADIDAGRFNELDYDQARDVMESCADDQARYLTDTEALVTVADLEVDENTEEAERCISDWAAAEAEQRTLGNLAWNLLAYAGYQVCQEVFADVLQIRGGVKRAVRPDQAPRDQRSAADASDDGGAGAGQGREQRHAPSTDTERLIDTDEWEVVSTLHGEDCPECMRCAESGAILARVRGSAEGGQVIDHRGEDGELVVDHQAVVRRNRSGDDS